MKYEKALDVEVKAREVIEKLRMDHVKIENVAFIRSFGSKSRRTIARCHGLGKVMQLGLNRGAFYVLEFLNEKFDKLHEEEKLKVIIHELMHIPKNFGGGFKHHNYVNDRNIEKLYKQFKLLS